MALCGLCQRNHDGDEGAICDMCRHDRMMRTPMTAPLRMIEAARKAREEKAMRMFKEYMDAHPELVRAIVDAKEKA